jgi:RNA 2',3'-cyclic 3'-phosphodiesterase
MRLFIAINLPDKEKQRLSEALAAIAERHPLPVRWLATDSLHITLKFLGETAESMVPQLEQALHHASHDCEEFDVTIGGFGAFPSSSRPSILWVGVTAPVELLNLQQQIEAGLTPFGFEPEGRPFKPHITVARAEKNARIRDRAQMDRIVGEFDYKQVIRVRSVDLMRSFTGPRGARYELLRKVDLH